MVCLLAILAWGALLTVSPYYRTKFIIRQVAALDPNVAVNLQTRFFIGSKPTNQIIRALTDLLSDPNPQVRYIAVRWLSDFRYNHFHPFYLPLDEQKRQERIEFVEMLKNAGLEKKLHESIKEEPLEIAANAISMLSVFRNDRSVDLLISIIKDCRNEITGVST